MPQVTHPVLRLTGVGRRYHPERPPVLEGIDLEVGPGEYVAILGESGVGKSTLLNLVAGLDRPDAGTIEIDGEALHAMDDDAATLLRRRRVGFVFQAFHLLPHLTVLDNVALPLHLLGESRQAREQAAVDMLEAVGLGGFGPRFPRELSGGEMQRVAIARALVHSPRLLLADEPTGNLDPSTAARVLDLLRTRVLGRGASGVLITHSRAAAATAQRVLVLDGRSLGPLPAP